MATEEASACWHHLIELAGRPRDGAAVNSPGGEGARMSLASAGGRADTGGGDGLEQSAGPWIKAAGVAGDLREGARSSLARLGASHRRVTSEGRGLESVRALGAVRSSWEARLRDVRDECDALDAGLRNVAGLHDDNEHRVKSSFQKRSADRDGDAR
ncbi:hypothetical protein GCM10010420_25620 [Streptomyces glaucosporus]|uniref:Uncharacterized protein n=1 Tax=Streptomyces glaucosporus TaxID=284044 RepID=A0ABN3I9C2_9ACTN